MTDSRHDINIALVGDPGSGKSTFLHRAVKGEFGARQGPTHEDCIEFEGRSINIKLYDVYNSVAVGLIISSLGAIVMYNVLCRKSFEAAGKDWMDLVLRMKGVKKFPVVIIATHCDQGTEEDWQVPHSDGAALADQIGCPFLETSAKDNINIDETITDVLAEIMGSQALEGAGRAKRKRGGCVVC